VVHDPTSLLSLARVPQVRLVTSMTAIPPSSAVSGSDPLGFLELTGWTEASAPVVTVEGSTFSVTSATRVSRDVQSWRWNIDYTTNAEVNWVDGEANEIVFHVTVAPAGAFAGMSYSVVFRILEAYGQPYRAFVCNAAGASCALASTANVMLNEDMPAGVLAMLQFRNTSTVDPNVVFGWTLVGVSPSVGIFDVSPSSGALSTTSTAAALGVTTGEWHAKHIFALSLFLQHTMQLAA
jgi:hypothetical protein